MSQEDIWRRRWAELRSRAGFTVIWSFYLGVGEGWAALFFLSDYCVPLGCALLSVMLHPACLSQSGFVTACGAQISIAHLWNTSVCVVEAQIGTGMVEVSSPKCHG